MICRGATGVISSHGVGACLEVGPVNIGGGVVYRPFEIKVWLLDGCKWSRFDEISLRASDASATRVVRIAPGSPSRMIQLMGSTGAPQVKVTGPGGQALQSSATSGFVNKGAIRILRSDQLKLTAVGLQNPHPGVYRIEPLPGSSSIKSFGEASDPPDAQVTASVQGTGARRTLVYDIRRRPDQRVTFSEVGGGSTATIGTVNGGGRGQLLFSPAPGTGVRHVIAQFELAGLPAESLTVPASRRRRRTSRAPAASSSAAAGTPCRCAGPACRALPPTTSSRRRQTGLCRWSRAARSTPRSAGSPASAAASSASARLLRYVTAARRWLTPAPSRGVQPASDRLRTAAARRSWFAGSRRPLGTVCAHTNSLRSPPTTTATTQVR